MTSPLTPPEALMLIAPKGAASELVKVAFMYLALKRLILFEVEVKKARLHTIKTTRVHVDRTRLTDQSFGDLPLHLRAIVSAAEAANGGTVLQVVKQAKKSFGATLDRYKTAYVGASLAERGLIKMVNRRFLWAKFQRPEIIDAGMAEQARLRDLMARARDVPNFISRDPKQAAMIAASLGSLVLLVAELRPHLATLAGAMRDLDPNDPRRIDGADFSDLGGSDDVLDVSGFDTVDFDSSVFDAGAFDAMDGAMDSFDSGFDSSSSDSGGDSISSSD